MTSETDDRWIRGPGYGVAMPFIAHRMNNIPDIIGQLVESVGATGITSHLQTQIDAWRTQINVLRDASTALGECVADWTLVLEFDIPRRGKRIDAVLLAGLWIIVLEFKVGASNAGRDAIRRPNTWKVVEQYCSIELLAAKLLFASRRPNSQQTEHAGS